MPDSPAPPLNRNDHLNPILRHAVSRNAKLLNALAFGSYAAGL
jgi:hypothetical protein